MLRWHSKFMSQLIGIECNKKAAFSCGFFIYVCCRMIYSMIADSATWQAVSSLSSALIISKAK